jgi:hypothetical protein
MCNNGKKSSPAETFLVACPVNPALARADRTGMQKIAGTINAFCQLPGLMERDISRTVFFRHLLQYRKKGDL